MRCRWYKLEGHGFIINMRDVRCLVDSLDMPIMGVGHEATEEEFADPFDLGTSCLLMQVVGRRVHRVFDSAHELDARRPIK